MKTWHTQEAAGTTCYSFSLWFYNLLVKEHKIHPKPQEYFLICHYQKMIKVGALWDLAYSSDLPQWKKHLWKPDPKNSHKYFHKSVERTLLEQSAIKV